MLHRIVIVAALAGVVLVVACTSTTLDPSITYYEVGDCIKDPNLGVPVGLAGKPHRVDCSEPGTLRATLVFQISLLYDDYPGVAVIQSITASECPFGTAVVLAPKEESWNDDREVACFE